MNSMARSAFRGVIVLLGASVFGVLGAVVASANQNATILELVCIVRFDNPAENTRAFIVTPNGVIITIQPDVSAARTGCDALAESEEFQCRTGVLRPPHADEIIPGEVCDYLNVDRIEKYKNPWVCYGVQCP